MNTASVGKCSRRREEADILARLASRVLSASLRRRLQPGVDLLDWQETQDKVLKGAFGGLWLFGKRAIVYVGEKVVALRDRDRGSFVHLVALAVGGGRTSRSGNGIVRNRNQNISPV